MIKINKIFIRSFCESIKNNLEKDFLKLDYYSILALDRNASDLEIKKSYLRLAKNFHPDKFKGSTEIFKKISDAYNTLKDPMKRDNYDKFMKFRIIKKRKAEKQSTSEDEKPRENSKFEEDFKKLNIEKLFVHFTLSKIKNSPEHIKVKINFNM